MRDGPGESQGQLLQLSDHQLVGEFFPAASPGPGVIAFSGSDGGCPVEVGRRLAGEGFSCLSLRYFRARGLPPDLVEVPLDYVEHAVRWLCRQPSVAEGRLGVIGVSKGAELALLCATYFPEHIGAAVAYAPSAVAFAGISFGGDSRPRSSWSYRGEPVPFVPYAQAGFRRSLSARRLALAPIYRAALQNAYAVERARIAIENTGAHFLLISGGNDQIWPSSQMAEMLVARMTGAGQRERVEHLHFRNAGHNFMPWTSEITPRPLGQDLKALRLCGSGGVLGGTHSANRLARQETWSKAVTFLRSRLG
jgi:uncharacterized protein